jgi:hypothetical protein
LSPLLPPFSPFFLPACLLACLPSFLPAYLPACLPACLPAFPSSFLPFYLPSFQTDVGTMDTSTPAGATTAVKDDGNSSAGFANFTAGPVEDVDDDGGGGSDDWSDSGSSKATPREVMFTPSFSPSVPFRSFAHRPSTIGTKDRPMKST